MNDLSPRPGLWINYTNSQATISVFDHRSSSEQPTLPRISTGSYNAQHPPPPL